ncbi:MAG: hypothetical protein Q7R70_03690 [Candidatus Diapherotrites archaeon]|nr:hypothetical protein [Candidatus Diapherotrites archaeon]
MAILKRAGIALKCGMKRVVNRQRIGLRRRSNSINLPFILQNAGRAADIAEADRNPVSILKAIKELKAANKAVLDSAVLAKRKGQAASYADLQKTYKTHLKAIEYFEKRFKINDRRAKE